MRRLWAHEILRVYSDRLVDDADRRWLFNSICTVASNELNTNAETLFQRFAEPGQKLQESDMRKLMYCDFSNPKADQRHYIEVQDLEELRIVVEAYLIEFNNMSKKPMNLVLFRFAIEHLSRICRILKQPRSHAMLIGVGGSGRQSLTRLAAHIADYAMYGVEITRQYGTTEWHDDIKLILRTVSSSDLHGVFMFTDSQIKRESFLEDINNMLNSGEVPNLFSNDEKVEICEKMRQIDRQRDKSVQTDGSTAALFNLFVTIVREQLHIVLCMSPIGAALRNRVRKFPAIVNCCTIDWFQPWPPDALIAVSTRFLSEETLSDIERKAAIDMCLEFHTSTQTLSNDFFLRLKRHNYVTPTSYLELILTFKQLLNEKRQNVLNSKNRYLMGLKQLDIAAQQVAIMQVQLEVMEPQLKIQADIVAVQVEQVEVAVGEAEEQRGFVKVDEQRAMEQAAIASEIANNCAAIMAEAMPLVREAETALNTLTSADITVVRTMNNPPIGVKIVMEAVCILKDIKPEKVPNPSGVGTIETYWKPSQKLLSDMKFLESLIKFEKDTIPAACITKLHQRILTNENFDPEKVKLASTAAEGLCKWVIAIVQYDKVAKVVAPKRIQLKEAEDTRDVSGRFFISYFLIFNIFIQIIICRLQWHC